MNLLIPLRSDRQAYTLKYAIRSICQHNDITRCLLVGFKPDWFTGEHLAFPNYKPDYKERNIRDKVNAGAHLMEDFLFANDDHFMNSPYLGTLNKGPLSEVISTLSPHGSYTHLLNNTLQLFGDVPCTDIHYPLMMNREGVEKVMFDWPRWGYGLKTCYTEMNHISSTYMKDMKLHRLGNIDYPFFSTSSICQNLKLLDTLYPNKSIFER